MWQWQRAGAGGRVKGTAWGEDARLKAPDVGAEGWQVRVGAVKHERQRHGCILLPCITHVLLPFGRAARRGVGRGDGGVRWCALADPALRGLEGGVENAWLERRMLGRKGSHRRQDPRRALWSSWPPPWKAQGPDKRKVGEQKALRDAVGDGHRHGLARRCGESAPFTTDTLQAAFSSSRPPCREAISFADKHSPLGSLLAGHSVT